MMPTHYDRERLAQAHFQELLLAAERERLLAQLPRPNRNRLLLSLRALRLKLQHGFQRRTA